MKIVVLGNGFDLACGLPTTYRDFFDYYTKSKSSEFELIDKLVDFSFKSESSKSYADFLRGNALENNQLLNRKQINMRLSDAINKDFNDATALFNKYIEELIQGKINFWDIYFWIMKKEYSWILNNWCDVEDKISAFLSKDNNSDKINVGHYPNDLGWERFKPDIHSIPSNYFENILNVGDAYKIRVLIQKFIYSSGFNTQSYDLYNFFLEQLELFEVEFKTYIKRVLDENVSDNRVNQRTYRDNFIRLIDDDSEDNYFLINFNYTGLSISSKNKSELKSELRFSRNNQEIKISELNVHGRCDRSVIFGIDQAEVDATSPAYIFTKTYRKISKSNELTNLALPNKSDIDEIVFYGHSLSKADYSYFQSIFDFYDIYHSSIKLKFLYSFYGESQSYKKIKGERLKSVTTLIQTYGNTMTNEDHGKNLIHKLLLENRLEVKEVKLTDIGSIKTS